MAIYVHRQVASKVGDGPKHGRTFFTVAFLENPPLISFYLGREGQPTFLRNTWTVRLGLLHIFYAADLNVRSAAFFGLFTATMTGSSLGMTISNETQVERLAAKSNKTYTIAALISPRDERSHTALHLPYPVVTYPLEVGYAQV
jgi:hypothetical protein